MTRQDQAGSESSRDQTPQPKPVTPSAGTERQAGLAFDVEKGADLAGVPTGDQYPDHPGAAHTEQVVTETGSGVGLTVPGDKSSPVVPADDEASES